jgi:hypothetical protein
MTKETGIWGKIATQQAVLPLKFMCEVGKNPEAGYGYAYSKVGVEAGISMFGGGGRLVAARVAQVSEKYLPGIQEMQNFYRSLPLETQELLGEPDLALYGILRGGIWLAARAGDVVDIGVELVHNPVDTLRNAYQSVKSAVHAAVDGLAAAECICVDPVAFRLSLNQHVEQVVRANGLSEAGMIAWNRFYRRMCYVMTRN